MQCSFAAMVCCILNSPYLLRVVAHVLYSLSFYICRLLFFRLLNWYKPCLLFVLHQFWLVLKIMADIDRAATMESKIYFIKSLWNSKFQISNNESEFDSGFTFLDIVHQMMVNMCMMMRNTHTQKINLVDLVRQEKWMVSWILEAVVPDHDHRHQRQQQERLQRNRRYRHHRLHRSMLSTKIEKLQWTVDINSTIRKMTCRKRKLASKLFAKSKRPAKPDIIICKQ